MAKGVSGRSRHKCSAGMAAVTLLGFFTGKGAKGGSISSLTRLVRLGAGLIPLIKLAMQGASRKG